MIASEKGIARKKAAYCRKRIINDREPCSTASYKWPLRRFPGLPTSVMVKVYSEESDSMSNPQQPNIRMVNAAEYRDSYANSIQIRVSVWDFLLVFGRLHPLNAQDVEVQNFQGIYLSPQQAKA